MKKVLIQILILAGMIFSAEFELTSYSCDMGDLDARQQSSIFDDNGNRPGLLKIYSDQIGLQVQSNLGVIETDKTHKGEFWVYLSQGEKWIKISKEGFSPFEFVLEPSIESDTVYILKLGTINYGSVIDPNMHKITFKLNTSSAFIARGNSAPMQVNGKISEYNLSKGEHEFTFLKEGFIDKKEKIIVDGDREIDVNLEPGDKYSKLKMPAIVGISSEPTEAEIYLNGQKYCLTPMQESLIAGDYTIVIKKDLYYPYEGSFTVNEGQTKEVPLIRLKPKKIGYYTIESEPEGIKIYIDGVYVGESPIKKTKIEIGRHVFIAESELYHIEKQESEFKESDVIDIKFIMKPAHGKLVINSEPAGAVVWLNGVNSGTTPFALDKAKSGVYKVKITKDLWSDYEETLEVADTKTTERTLVMNKNCGALKIKAERSDIFINGIKEGNGVFQGNLKPGKYDIIAKRDKHKDAKKEIFVNIGREQEIELTPEPILGSVNIFSEPLETKGAKIILNEEEKGVTPAVIPLLIGDYKLKLSMEGYLDKSEDFSLTEGENKTLKVVMQSYKGSQDYKRNFWKKQKWYAAGVFVASIGAGSYFYYQGNNYYDDYKSANIENSSTKKAEELYDNVLTADKYRNISFSVSLVPLCYYFYAWHKEASYK